MFVMGMQHFKRLVIDPLNCEEVLRTGNKVMCVLVPKNEQLNSGAFHKTS
jgi:hypothetical protein